MLRKSRVALSLQREANSVASITEALVESQGGKKKNFLSRVRGMKRGAPGEDSEEGDADDSILVSKRKLQKELKQIKTIANMSGNHYVNSQNKQMQLLIKTNEDGTYEFIEQQRVLAGYENSRLMLRLNDPKKTRWDLIIIGLAIYNSFQIPFEIAFSPPEMKRPLFYVVNSVIDLFFLMDIIVNFRTTFYDIETGDEVFDARRTGLVYLKGRFTVDLLSTIPFDNIALIFTQSSSPVLQLFSLLKLVRISRLGRIIERLNVTQDMKNALKLFKLIFVIIIYIHGLACLWFVIVQLNSEWVPPLDFVDPDADFYNSSLANRYFITLYHAVLLLTGNDIVPRGTFQVAFVATFITIGAIINANIFGNMALIISDLNRKSAEFQGQIDTANTAMKNMKLP